ncbi:MAG: CBS domain-containing protein [Desulfobacterales bacterium]
MRIKKLLDEKGHEVFSTSPDTMVYDALKLMAEKEIGALVVLDKGKMVGIISERDYARKIILKGKKSKHTPVRKIMTTKVVHTTPKQKLIKCLNVMTKHHFRHMPVFDEDKLVGVISIEDIKKKM